VDTHVEVAIWFAAQGHGMALAAVGHDVPALFRHGYTPGIACKQLDCFHAFGKKLSS
jgi:hypothetical protein